MLYILCFIYSIYKCYTYVNEITNRIREKVTSGNNLALMIR